MTTISNDNLYSATFSEIKAFLDGISGLDPRGRYKANWIHSSMPHINQKGFDGYPFIVLKIDVNEDNNSIDNSVSTKTFRILLSIYSDDPSVVDTIAESIYNSLKSKSNLTELKNKNLSSSPLNWDLDLNGKKISYRNIGIIGNKRI